MNETMNVFVQISIHRMLDHYLPKLTISISILDTEMLWMHEVEGMNSIGGIVLHIEEHLKRHIQRYSKSGVLSGGIENCFPDLGISVEGLNERFSSVMIQWSKVMTHYTSEEQGSNINEELNDIYHLVEHTGYHLGQIIDRVQRLTETSFQFVQNGINEKNLKEQLRNFL